MTATLSYVAPPATAPLAPFSFDRRSPGDEDVAIDILYCGVCHSDLHTARNECNNPLSGYSTPIVGLGGLGFMGVKIAAAMRAHVVLFTTSAGKREGTMTLVGAPASPHTSPGIFNLIMRRRRLAGSLISGLRETQEMLDFCSAHDILSDIEMIRMDEIEAAYARMPEGDVRVRFVIDLATLAVPAA